MYLRLRMTHLIAAAVVAIAWTSDFNTNTAQAQLVPRHGSDLSELLHEPHDSGTARADVSLPSAHADVGGAHLGHLPALDAPRISLQASCRLLPQAAWSRPAVERHTRFLVVGGLTCSMERNPPL